MRPTYRQIRHWHERYERTTNSPKPADHDIDHNWLHLKSLHLADGGFNGGIHLVRNKMNHELAIRKIICADPECLAYDHLRWRREMLIMRKLQHPNIPYYIDGFCTPNNGSIYMQPCRLGSLGNLIDSGRMQYMTLQMREYLLWHVLHQIAQAVLYLQTGFRTLADADRSRDERVEGWVVLVHGDIRPDQIFLHNPEDGGLIVTALLGDFGFAQFIRPWRRTEVHDGPGSSSISKAPEFPHQISEATDIFALGATAQLYLAPDAQPRTGLKVGQSSYFLVSEDLDELICGCVAVSPFDRPSIRRLLWRLEAGLFRQRVEGMRLSQLFYGPPLFDELEP